MASLDLQRVFKRYGDDHGHPRRGPRDPRRRVRRVRRSVRLRQVDPVAHDRGTGIGQRRRTCNRRQARQRHFCGAPRPGDGLPVVCAVSAYDRVPEPGVRTGKSENAARRDRRQGAGGRTRCFASSRCSSGGRRNFPADNGSASPSGEPSCGIRRSSSSTSRCRTSTPNCACRCGRRSAALHQRLGTTMIYVTHDQVEAMTMADRIVVLRGGRVEQIGTPLDLYNRPANRFVAGFIGSPQMNFLGGTIVSGSGHAHRGDARRRGSRLLGSRPASGRREDGCGPACLAWDPARTYRGRCAVRVPRSR